MTHDTPSRVFHFQIPSPFVLDRKGFAGTEQERNEKERKSKMRKLLMALAAVAVMSVSALAEDINYSDGQVHDLTVTDGDTADSITLSAKSTLNVTGGALTNSTGKIVLSGGSTLSVGSGASVLTGSGKTSTAAFVKISGASKLIVDGGTVTLPASNSKIGTTQIGNGTNADNSEVKVINGGSLKIDGGQHGLSMHKQVKLTVVDSTFDLLSGNNWTYSWLLNYGNHTIAVTNSTVNFYKIYLGGNNSSNSGASGSKLYFHNSTDKTSAKQDSSNVGFTFYGSKTTKNNLVRFTGSQGWSNVGFDTSGASATDNTVELHDGTFGGYLRLVSGSGNKFVQKGGSWATGYQCRLGATANEFQILGGEFGGENGQIQFLASADGCKATFQDCAGELKVYQDSAPLSFAAGAQGSSLVVSSNATLSVMGKVALNAAVTDCYIEFRGENPKMTISNWGTISSDYIWSLGSDDEANADKTVALKFVLPKEPYASAPFYANAAKPVNLKKYTKIIVEEGDWTIGTDKTKTFYPLAYDAKSFNSEMTAELVASLNANATLPEGAALEYDSAKKVLGVRMPRKKMGLILVVQ